MSDVRSGFGLDPSGLLGKDRMGLPPTPLRADDPFDPGQRGLELVRSRLDIDDTWADDRGDGFTWWAFRLAQRFDVDGPTDVDGVPTWWLAFETDVLHGLPQGGPDRAQRARAPDRPPNPFTVVERDGRLRHRGRVFLRPDSLERHARMLADRAAYSNALGHLVADRVASRDAGRDARAGARPDTSSHPRAGERDERAGVLSIADAGPNPAAIPSGWAPDLPLMRQAVPRGATLARSDRGAPIARFDVAGLPAVVKLEADVDHAVLGRGLEVALGVQLPDLRETDGPRPLAAALGHAARLVDEETSAPLALLSFGSWAPDRDAMGLPWMWHVSYHPNAALDRDSPRRLAVDAVARAGWAARRLVAWSHRGRP